MLHLSTKIHLTSPNCMQLGTNAHIKQVFSLFEQNKTNNKRKKWYTTRNALSALSENIELTVSVNEVHFVSKNKCWVCWKVLFDGYGSSKNEFLFKRSLQITHSPIYCVLTVIQHEASHFFTSEADTIRRKRGKTDWY